MYNLTNLTDSTNLLGIAEYANQATNGWFWTGTLVLIYVFTFVLSRNTNTTNTSLATSGITTTFIAIILYVTGLLPSSTLTYFIIMGSASTLLLIFGAEYG